MVSLVHKAIFVHIPKCAGQSVEESFLRDISPSLSWDRHRHLIGCFQKPPSWGPTFPMRLAHLTASEYVDLNFVSREVWDASFRFAIVRDPIDRMVSTWKYLGVRESFDTFATTTVPKAVAEGQFFYRSQCDYLFRKGEPSVAVDLVLPIRSLARRWGEVQARCGLRAELVHRNTSHDKPNPVVSETAAAAIREVYADDYARLGRWFAD